MTRLASPLLLLLAACSGAAPTTLQDSPASQDAPPTDDDAATRPDVTELPAVDGDASSDDDASSEDDAAPDAGVCVDYAAPDADSTCHACSGTSCQSNGCFGGYYCDLVTSHCVARPSGC